MDKADDTQSTTLTCKRLSALPTRNKMEFVSRYVEVQKSFRKLYSSEGQGGARSWRESEHQGGLQLPPPKQTPLDCLWFGTPVLKARKRAPCEPRGVNTTQSQKHKDARIKAAVSIEKNYETIVSEMKRLDEKNKTDKQVVHHATSPSTERIKEPKSKGKSRKRGLNAEKDGDGEQGERFEERKKRRKIKKDIMTSTNRPVDSDGGREKAGKQKGKTKAIKPQAAFALMHGFTTTSVGKNRLTLEPRLSIGVFKKGKASKPVTHLPQKSREHARDACFSESQFLEKTKKAYPVKNLPTASSRAPSAHSLHSEKRLLSGKYAHTESDQRSQVSSKASEVVRRRVRSPYNPNGSIVWDIEEDGCSQLSPDSVADEREGTVLVKFPLLLDKPRETLGNHELSRSVSRLAISGSNGTISHSGNHSHLSLGPSQSASQVQPRASATTERNVTLATTSAYFKSLERVDDQPSDPNLSRANQEQIQRLFDQEDVLSIGVPDFLDGDRGVLDVNVQDELFVDSAYTTPAAGEPFLSGNIYLVSGQALPVTQECALSESSYPLSSCFWLLAHDGETDTCQAQDIAATCSVFGDAPDFDAHWGLDTCGEDNLGSSNSFHNPALLDPVFCIPDVLTNFTGHTSDDLLDGGHEYCDEEEDDDIRGLSPYVWNLGVDEEEGGSICRGQISDATVIYPSVFSQMASPEPDMSSDAGSNDHMDAFFQGRTLLQGLNSWPERSGIAGVYVTEVEVAGLLKVNHWHPQKL